MALAAAGSAEASPYLWAGSLTATTMAFVLFGPAPTDRPLSLAARVVLGFAGWVALTNLWLSPTYTPAASYHAAFLAAGFLLARRAAPDHIRTLFLAASVLAVGLAAWALWQRAHGVSRATALFETPAILVAAINLVLIPLLAVGAWRKDKLALAVATLLLAALFAAASRGGWLALMAGVLVALGIGRRLGLRFGGPEAARVAACVAGGYVVYAVAGLFPAASSGGLPAISMIGQAALDSSVDRLGMYTLALRSLDASLLMTGIGYLGFYYVMEAQGHTISGIAPGVTYFVHNDYLQALLELGLPGLFGLAALVLLPLYLAWCAATVPPAKPRAIAIGALAGALASLAAHAAVDFPFYIPLCLLIYGGAFGSLDALVRPAPATPPTVPSVSRRIATATAGTLAAWALLTPLAAQAAADYAHRRWQAGDGARAAYGFELARRVEPRDWRYHWYAGQFWLAHAAAGQRPEPALRADQAFAAGIAANALEARNLTGRIATHRQLGALLPAAGGLETLLAWSERAVALAPNDPAARRQREALRQALIREQDRARR